MKFITGESGSSCCPLCAQASLQVHSQYQRTLYDVPCGGRKFVLSARDSHIRELQRFVGSIERDKVAVLAGLTLPQSIGIVEGKVNKLKLMKRMEFGIAGFPLLRQRVLHALS